MKHVLITGGNRFALNHLRKLRAKMSATELSDFKYGRMYPTPLPRHLIIKSGVTTKKLNKLKHDFYQQRKRAQDAGLHKWHRDYPVKVNK